jgi:four helix bundle protein
MKSFRDLRVWNEAVDFAVLIYAATGKFPARENFGLTSQLRNAAVSISSNIAEGHGRITAGERLQFLGHSRGSLFELETQLIVANRIGYLPDAQFQQLAGIAGRLGQGLTGLINWTAKESSSDRAQPETGNRKS